MKSAKLNIRPEFNRSAVEIALVVSQSPELAAAGLQGALVRGKNVPALVADPCSKAEKKNGVTRADALCFIGCRASS
jgi:hypothetical protein